MRPMLPFDREPLQTECMARPATPAPATPIRVRPRPLADTPSPTWPPRSTATKQPQAHPSYDAATAADAVSRAPIATSVERAKGLEPSTFSLGSGMAGADKSGQEVLIADKRCLEVTRPPDNVVFRVPGGARITATK